MHSGNGLGGLCRLTQNTYRVAVSEVVRDVQTTPDHDFAEQWGVSAGTVGNARNQNNNLDAINLLKLIHKFGGESVDPIFALVGCKVVARDGSEADTDAAVRAALYEAHQFVGEAMQYQLDGKDCHVKRGKLAKLAGSLIRRLGDFRRRVSGRDVEA